MLLPAESIADGLDKAELEHLIKHHEQHVKQLPSVTKNKGLIIIIIISSTAYRPRESSYRS